MAGTELGSAYISVGLGTNKLGPEIKKVFSGIDADAGGAGESAAKNFQGKFSGFMKAAAVPALGVVAGIGLIAKNMGDLAATAEQNLGAVGSVFKGAAGEVAGFASASATSLGISSSEYNQFAAMIGSQFKNAGVPLGELAGKTNDLITKGADLASMFGGTTTEAVEALSSALKGEMDPIERYGISLNESAIKAKLAELGLSGLEGAAGQAAKTQAVLALVSQQSADATGNFARESGTAAGAQQIANAAWADASAKLGAVLLPIMTAAATKIAELSSWVSQNTGLVTGLAIGVGVLAAVIGVWAAVQGVLNLVMLASPITWVILGVIALIAAVVLLAANWRQVVAFLTSAWAGFMSWLNGAISNVVNWFSGLPGRILGALGNLGGLLLGAAGQIMSGFLSGLTRGFEDVKNFVGGIGQWIADNKGPKAYDLALLVPAGGWIMQGLEDGIEGSMPSLQRTLGGVSATIASSVGGASYSPAYTPASAGGPGAVNVYIGNEQLDSRMFAVAGSAISSADSQSQFARRGR